MDATGAENHCTILAIEPSFFDENLIWVGTDDGNIQLTLDGGTTWQNVAQNIKDMPKEAWVAQIRASQFNKAEAYVVVNNYRQFDFKPYLFRTRDYGKTWENILEEKNETFGYTLSMIQDVEEPNLLFLGTEYGLYISVDEGKNWTKWTNNYPTVPTMDLAIQPREHDLVIGTFGRAIFVIDDIRPFRALANEGSQLLEKTLHLFNPPKAFITQSQQPSGTRFGANAIFNGENKPGGAMITYVINLPKPNKGEASTSKKNKSKKANAVKVEKPTIKYDSIFFEVFNDKNQLVRNDKVKAPKENGLYRIYSSMRENGVHRPSRRKLRKNAPNPRGVQMLPGTYTFKMHFGNKSVSEQIELAYDPRVEISDEVLKAKYDLLKQVEEKSKVASDAMQQLIGSKEIVQDYQKRIKSILNKEKSKDLLKSHTEIIKKIDGLMDAMLGKVDKRQGITANEFPSPVRHLRTASRYVNSLQQLPGETEKNLIKNADLKVSAVIDDINKFYKKDWVEYQNLVKELELSPFKGHKELIYE